MNDPSQSSMPYFPHWNPSIIDPSQPHWLPTPAFSSSSNRPRVPWKQNKKSNYKNKKNPAPPIPPSNSSYHPPSLTDLQRQNRAKARRFYRKLPRSAPYAPRNTSSFIMRAKRSGGITSLVSPCPVTPAVLPTPRFSPSHEGTVELAKEEWGVDGYGSMSGLIRLRSPDTRPIDDDLDDAEDASSESDVEEHIEVERRLDHDLSRFEMVYQPNSGEVEELPLAGHLDNQDQDAHIVRLEEENLTLKERLFLMESEMRELRMRLEALETGCTEVMKEDEERGKNANVNEAASDNEGGGNVSLENNVED